MRRTPLVYAALFATLLFSASVFSGEDYKLGPDSEEQAGVPKGTVSEHKFTESKIYPGTSRNYWIYLPPNFNADTAYPIMIFFDGGGAVATGPKAGMRVPTVFDNLIHKKEIPPLVGLFINPGDVPAVAPGARGRSTRSFEYDAPDDTNARFLLDEMIPLAAKHAKLSDKPEDRALCGTSSGGIAAFAAAWNRPDAFSKVISFIGSFTNIRGGYWFPSAIRKTERKPIRVFLQDGKNDLDNVHGNWPMGAQEMANALKFAGYDHKFVFGDGGHSGKHGASILPDALRWLWRAPEPLPAPTPEVPNDMALSGVLIPGEDWQVVVDHGSSFDAACTDADGNFYFSAVGGEGLSKISLDGKIAPFNVNARGVSSMCFGPDGKLYANSTHGEGSLIAFDKDGKEELLVKGARVQKLVVNHLGNIYYTVGLRPKLMLRDRTGVVKIADESDQGAPMGLALTPNQETLAVSDYNGSAAWAFRVEADGSLGAKMPLMPFSQYGGNIERCRGESMICDTRARFYCVTTVSTYCAGSSHRASGFGIDVYDPNGRPIGLMLPPDGKAIRSIALSGPGMNWLFAVTDKKIYKRKVNATGFATYLPPILGNEKKGK